MVKNICLTVQYDGSAYYGLQIQRAQRAQRGRRFKTVQSELEKAIRKLFRKRIRIIHSGRTDRGVHAKDQRVNFKVATTIPKKNIKQALNTYLPGDINVKKVSFVSDDFHARFSARSKLYRYRILNQQDADVFLRDHSWWFPQRLDLSAMRRAAQILKGRRDFSAFAQQAATYRSCARRLTKIGISKKGSQVIIDIEAEGFLRGMARNIVSLLVDVGSGRRSEKSVTNLIKTGKRSLLGRPAPAQGLYLWRVRY
jgi:tRNA pseudouridine38-40 synthase